jgi:hypothetical protein
MSNETISHNPETGHELLPSGGEHIITAHSEHAPTAEQEASEKQHMQHESRSAAAAETAPTNVVEAFQANEDAKSATTIIRESTKTVSQRKLKEVQRKLKPADRKLSRVIHQPAVRAVSEAAGSSVSRPSGLLGGGLVAFLGSGAYLYFTRHYGIRYNYFVFILLFVGGFVLGLLLELLVWMLNASRRSHIE